MRRGLTIATVILLVLLLVGLLIGWHWWTGVAHTLGRLD